jgi:hypothetical protein
VLGDHQKGRCHVCCPGNFIKDSYCVENVAVGALYTEIKTRHGVLAVAIAANVWPPFRGCRVFIGLNRDNRRVSNGEQVSQEHPTNWLGEPDLCAATHMLRVSQYPLCAGF